MFGNILSKIRKPQSAPNEAPSHWIKCPSCNSLMYYKEVQACFNVCPKCAHHMRLSAKERVELLADVDSFKEYDENLQPNDPLKFVDKKSYKKRIDEGVAKTGRYSSAISGECSIDGLKVQLVVFDFAFMGGSLGSVEGEKITRAVKRAIAYKQPLVIVSASGGARMQESSFSLMQMSKTSAALQLLADAKLPYISVLTDPTMGGVSASFAWLGDIIIAEQGARVGFAGRRVIEQTIRQKLPADFQTAEYLMKYGQVDVVSSRKDLKATIANILAMHE